MGSPVAYSFKVHVLGCKVNQYEAQQLRTLAEAMGLRTVARGASADVVLIHTCAVTARALRKSLQAARTLYARHDQAPLIVTGCGAAVPAFEAPQGAVCCVPPGPDWLHRVATALRAALPDLPAMNLPECADHFPIESFAGHARAFLKIQDGCDNACAYCIVPSLRGPSRDKERELILQEARSLSRAGFRELVISGVSVGLYGRSTHQSLADVMRALVDLPETERLRLSSLHPNELTPELLDVWAQTPKMLPHVHLPLQAGSDSVLRRMNRGYSQREFLDAVARVRARLDTPAFTTDIIVGFPGETPADFIETMHVCRQAGFSRIHIFPYSPRPGTRAGKKPVAAGAVVKKQCEQLAALADELAAAFYRPFAGRTIHVLVHQCGAGLCHGYSDRYMPVTFQGPSHLRGDIIAIRIDTVSAQGLKGTPA
ncbi:MAG: MiaB/RimO family radical SAM methylthiotransferase [Spartobacteria bacterium]|nr:MiaB/RimO family radical SAM methylthiotransferase [Spartobacteria bacterium]